MGRKRDGFWHSVNNQSNRRGGCLVPQEQLNAWVYINGQKSCAQGLLKLPISEKEYDCRVCSLCSCELCYLASVNLPKD